MTYFKMQLCILYLLFCIGFSFTPTTQQQSANENCNVCCQGTPGLPGVPGTAGSSGAPGHNGHPGRDGTKGEKGETGVGIKGVKGDIGPGQIGLSGPRGPIGENGIPGPRGLPGKTGPRGAKGVEGLDGAPGRIGLKREKGECPRLKKSAFTAIKTNEQTGNIGDVVTFQETPTNINSDYNLQSNKFTCQIPGTYVFMFAIGVHFNSNPVIWLVKKGNHILMAHAITRNDVDQSTNSAILDLEIRDQVWLQFAQYNGQSVHSDYNKIMSFSGFLLYEA